VCSPQKQRTADNVSVPTRPSSKHFSSVSQSAFVHPNWHSGKSKANFFLLCRRLSNERALCSCSPVDALVMTLLASHGLEMCHRRLRHKFHLLSGEFALTLDSAFSVFRFQTLDRADSHERHFNDSFSRSLGQFNCGNSFCNRTHIFVKRSDSRP
jgi:hypothetical protein